MHSKWSGLLIYLCVSKRFGLLMQVAAPGLSSNPQPSGVPFGGRNIRRALSYSRHLLWGKG